MTEDKIMAYRAVLERIDEWHERPRDGTPLYEFLGWTRDEYVHWVVTDELPEIETK